MLLAIALIVASVPLVSAAVAGDQQPAFRLDICHPAQVLSAASIQCSLPLPPAEGQRISPVFSGMAVSIIAPIDSRAADPPATPPPKIDDR